MSTTSKNLHVPYCSVRLPDFHTCDFRPEQHEELLALLARFPDVCDGVWFATDYGYPTIEKHHESARLMADMAAKLRDMGIACSLQISNSIGHSISVHHPIDGITWNDVMTGIDGQVAPTCHCPRSEPFREYLRVTLSEYARFEPDFVWIDDDFRMWGHGPVNQGCFCDACVAAFSTWIFTQKKTAVEGAPLPAPQGWTRETLAEALRKHENGLLRDAWITFSREQLADLGTFISKTIWTVSPNTNMGYQQACSEWGLYGGRDLGSIYRVLTDQGKRPAGCRGGGGHYSDYANRSMLSKAFDISRQFSLLPEGVDVRCPEIENFVHGAIGKTPLGTAMEAAVDVAIGSNCLSIANMMYQNEEISWHAGTFQKLSDWKPYTETILRESGTSAHAGMEVLMPHSQTARNLMPNENNMAWVSASLGHAYHLANIGLPLCTGPTAGTGVVLAPEAAKGIRKEELQACVARGLLLGGDSASILQERGFSSVIGANIRPLPAYISHECYTDDPLNGTNPTRKFMDSPFSGGPGVAIEPLHDDVRVLGTFQDANGAETGIYTVGISLPNGGRVGIIGHNPWETVISSKRRTQILNLADWVSGLTLPVMIETACQIVPIVRAEADGSIRTVTLLNQGFDVSAEVRLCIRLSTSQKGLFRWMEPEQPMKPLLAEKTTEGWILNLPSMERWSMGTIFCE